MNHARKFLKLRIDEKLNASNQSTKSEVSVTPSVTLNGHTYTPTPSSVIDSAQYLDIFPSIDLSQQQQPQLPPTLQNLNESNSNYISHLSLASISSLPSIQNGPHLNLHNFSSSSTQQYDSQRRRKSKSKSKSTSSHTLLISETCLTPNIHAQAQGPSSLLKDGEGEFSLDTVNTTSCENNQDDHDEKGDISINADINNNNNSSTKPIITISTAITCKDKDYRMEINDGRIYKKESTKTANYTSEDAEEENVDVDIEYAESKEDEKTTENDVENDDIMDVEMNFEDILLRKHGYKRGKKIATTLQGFIYELESIKDGKKFVVKKTDKHLHSNGITIQNGKKYAVKEDVLNERDILELITKQNAPNFMVKFIEFFESNDYYYLVMEHGGSDLFEFIIEAHKYIQNGKLSIKEWRKFIKYIFWQMCVILLWLHNTGNACHLDVSLENLLVQNAKFIDIGNGKLSISQNIQIKICDFGLAEFYDIDENNLDSGYLSTKYCGKTNYKSPQVYSKRGSFDGRKADVWSLGVVLFCMAVGAPPYKKPNRDDECYQNFIRKGHIAQLLYQWQRHQYVTERMLSLLKSMLNINESQRYSMDQVIQHPWLRTYYSRYYQLVKADLLSNIYKSKHVESK